MFITTHVVKQVGNQRLQCTRCLAFGPGRGHSQVAWLMKMCPGRQNPHIAQILGGPHYTHDMAIHRRLAYCKICGRWCHTRLGAGLRKKCPGIQARSPFHRDALRKLERGKLPSQIGAEANETTSSDDENLEVTGEPPEGLWGGAGIATGTRPADRCSPMVS